MTALFVTWACDWCDGLKSPPRLYRGFVVWQGPPPREGREMYVFPTRDDALRYCRAKGIEAPDLREVVSEHEIEWHKSRGKIRGLTLGARLVTVYPDRRFPPAPYRAYPAEARGVP